jgi:glutaredoxin-like protein NrdH
VKEFLSKNGIAYIDRDIENVPGALDELRALGFQSIPVTVISGQAVQGFNPKQFTELLQLGGKTSRRDPSETIPFVERVL